MKILVTGGTGFIGRPLVKALIQKGYQVKVMSRKTGGDLGNLGFLNKELNGIEAVFHLAAIAGQKQGISWNEYQKVNFQYTENLLKAAVANKVKRFIFCSSIQAARPVNFYARSKLMAEKAVQKSSLDWIIVRPGLVYGPEKGGGVWRLTQVVRQGIFPLVARGQKKLAIIFIDDLVRLFLKTLSSKIKNKVFWGIGETIRLKDLVDMISQKLDKPCLKLALPAITFKLAAMLLGKDIDFLSYDWVFKISREQKKLWQPKVKFREGVGKVI